MSSKRLGRHLLRAGLGCTLVLLGIVTGIVLCAKYAYVRGHYAVAIAVAREGPWAVSAHFDGLTLWYPGGPGEAPRALPAFGAVREPLGTRFLALAPDGRVAARLDWSGSLEAYDVESGRRIAFHERAHENTPGGLCFGPDGRAYSADVNGTVLAWDPELRRGEKVAVGLPVACLAASRETLLVGGTDGTIAVVDLATLTARRLVKPSGVALACVADAGGARLLAFGTDARVRVHGLLNGTELSSFAAGGGSPRLEPVVSPDGRLLAFGSLNPRVVHVIDLTTCALVGTVPFTLDEAWPTSGAIAPDGRSVLATTWTGEVVKLDLGGSVFDVASVASGAPGR